MEQAIKLSEEYTIIRFHNYGTNISPSGSDFISCGYRKYKFGVVVCHDGGVYLDKSGHKPFTRGLFDKRIEKYKQKSYNLSDKKAHIRVLNEFVEEYGIK